MDMKRGEWGDNREWPLYYVHLGMNLYRYVDIGRSERYGEDKAVLLITITGVM